jgi:hypothetical protein
MDMNLLGELIVAEDSGQAKPGFWMPASGNTGVAGVEVFWNSVADAFDVHLYTKSSDENDSAATSIGSVTVSSVGAAVYSFPVTEAKDLVRYQVESAAAGKVHLQFAQPLWQPE